MIAAIDVHYHENVAATIGAAVFADFRDPVACSTYVKHVTQVAPYTPGQFYRRELPCLLAMLAEVQEAIDTVIIDGYVHLGQGPGLGMYLWEALHQEKRVIGVAKTYYRGASPVKVLRPGCRRPLYVTAAGIDALAAGDMIRSMHGAHRLPTLLKQADSLSRSG